MEDRMEQLEHDVLRMFMEGDDPVLDALRRQLRLAKRKSRQMSGVGFFSYFDVPEEAPRLPGKASIRFADVAAEMDGLQYGAGFVLFIDNGVLTMLEGATFDEPWPQIISTYKLKYMNGMDRDLAALRSTPGWPAS